ncbi:MAG: SPFH domain-containing protein [Planctomycetes bacterium]|nr:SPFH domain-containing protein [Planctomycetota bacterium]
MQDEKRNSRTADNPVKVASGWGMLVLVILMFAAAPVLIITGGAERSGFLIGAGIVDLIAVFFLLPGFFAVQPNMARVLLLFGRYVGTVRDGGFHWTNPFYTKRSLSLRAHTLNGEKLKVNDRSGNPIEIAAVVVWRVRDTAQAVFDVEDYLQFVHIQSETAVRHLASTHPYDGGTDEEPSLRGSGDRVALELKAELQARLDLAGIDVVEARLAHLAYAPEIAGAMLRRQQAAAVIAARQKIVEGAVGMVHMALEHLEAKGAVVLDDERKAAMVSNLLVVLCSEQSAQPVINSGTLYN